MVSPPEVCGDAALSTIPSNKLNDFAPHRRAIVQSVEPDSVDPLAKTSRTQSFISPIPVTLSRRPVVGRGEQVRDKFDGETRSPGDHIVGEIPERDQVVLRGASATWFLVVGATGIEPVTSAV